jgi:lipopolysaccharide exporter
MKITGRQIAKGAAWMVLFKFMERGLGLISTIILARLLVPLDFGVVAMAMSVIAVLELMGAFSFDVALIQNSSAGRDHYDTAWTFNVLFALASALLLLVLALPMANFYTEPRLESVMYWLALGMAVQGFENIGVVAFRKDMRFDKEFKFLFGKKITSFAVTVPLAFILHDYWALVIGTLTGRAAGTVLSFVVHEYRPRFSLAARSELFHFSKWMLFNNIAAFLRFRSTDFIVGRFGGPHALGLFSVAYEISNLPTTELASPINRAVFPGYAKMSNDIPALRQSYLSTAAIITLLSLPAAFGIAAIAPLLVPVFLGANWLDAIPLIQILAVFGALAAIQNNNGPALLALGKPHVVTGLGILSGVLFLPTLIVLTMWYGVMGAAWANLIITFVMIPTGYTYIFRALDLRTYHIIREIWRPIVATAVMATIVHWYVTEIASGTGLSMQIMHLLAAMLIGFITYLVATLALWQISGRPLGAEQHILDYLRRRRSSRQRPTAPDINQ